MACDGDEMIRKLPKNISDKIAAGEVVERPLSVVKELVENAIDAKANAINISITDGGIKQIIVSDNGLGISAGEVNLAFEKHATSKISSERDLTLITTQGFRGEALSSIAAVSAVEMMTKCRSEELGTQLRIAGASGCEIKPVGLPDGTTVIVSRLFFNVPARLKFLKSQSKEAAYISDLVSRYILAFPEISFHYTVQQKTVYHSPGNGKLLDAIFCVYGNAVLDNIVYVDYESNGIKACGYVSRPGAAGMRPGSVFVNRRYIKSAVLSDIIRKAYGQTMVSGERPFYLLNITLPPNKVDVNVHPNKLSVRFADIAAVEHVIKEAVSAACRNIYSKVEISNSIPPAVKPINVQMRAPAEILQTEFFSGFERRTLSEKPADNAKAYEHKYNVDEPVLDLHYKLIGSFANTYVLVEQSENLLIIDQHAAHERLLYEKFIAKKSADSQTLLCPHVFKVTHEQKNSIDSNIQTLISLGFDIEPFGNLEYKLNAIPFGHSEDAQLLLFDALDEIRKSCGDVVLMRHAVIRAACRRAVKAGDRLPQEDLRSLISAFIENNVIPTCPHGRPVITIITKNQLEKSFKRVL